jgi:hypothetical protein
VRDDSKEVRDDWKEAQYRAQQDLMIEPSPPPPLMSPKPSPIPGAAPNSTPGAAPSPILGSAPGAAPGSAPDIYPRLTLRSEPSPVFDSVSDPDVNLSLGPTSGGGGVSKTKTCWVCLTDCSHARRTRSSNKDQEYAHTSCLEAETQREQQRGGTMPPYPLQQQQQQQTTKPNKRPLTAAATPSSPLPSGGGGGGLSLARGGQLSAEQPINSRRGSGNQPQFAEDPPASAAKRFRLTPEP